MEAGRSARHSSGQTVPRPTSWAVRSHSPSCTVTASPGQVASASHSGYAAKGKPTYGATVYVNASRGGVEVETTHDPFHLAEVSGTPAAAWLDAARATSAGHDRKAARSPR